MRDEIAFAAIDFLQTEFKRKFGKQALLAIKRELLTYSDKAMDMAADYFILKTNFLPTPDQLLERVKVEHRALCNADAIEREQEELRQRKTAPVIANIKPSSTFGKECLANMMALFDEAINKKDYLLAAQSIMDKHNRPLEESEWIQGQWGEVG